MTDEKDARENGCSRNSDGTMNNASGDKKYVTTTGDSGQLYVKELGRDSVYERYDPNKH